MKQQLLFALFILTTLMACQTTTPDIKDTPQPLLHVGEWEGAFTIDSTGKTIKIALEVISDQEIWFKNGEEKIVVNHIEVDSQQLRIVMPVFGSIFELVRQNDNQWKGKWINNHKKNYEMPFVADFVGKKQTVDTKPTIDFAERWQVTFSPNTPDAYPAIGLFEVSSVGAATGTFLTETGDYRYLVGDLQGDQLTLSCFDGAHVFLFEAVFKEAVQLLEGTFWSGKHWKESWTATPNDTFELAQMDTLTHLKAGFETIAFKLPTIAGDSISLTDSRFEGKPTIVQIMGTWCPNCMDETRFLVDMYEQYHTKGLEIVAIDFELIDNSTVFAESVARMQQDLGVQYPIVYGGYASKIEAAKVLPQLNHILSYPTSIFIDKQGKVKAIHTGFSGPGTGIIYDNYTKKTRQLIEELL